MKLKITLLIFILSLNANAQNVKDTFSIVVEGTRSHLNYIKAKSELKMARSTKFCRGSKMPKSLGEWSCRNTAPRLSNCVLEYRCHFVNKKFNRLSESRRLRSKLKNTSHLKSKYTISLLYKNKKEILTEIDSSRTSKNSSKKSFTSNFTTQQLERTTPKKVKRRKKIKKTKKPIFTNASKVKPDDELTFIDDEEVSKTDVYEENIEESLEQLVNTSDDENTDYNSLKNEKGSPSIGFKFIMNSFTANYISISDSEDNSLTTVGLAWTPHLWLSEHIALRGNFGFHSYSTVETDLVEAQSFLIYDTSIYAQYLFTNIFFEIGYGSQKWNIEGAESVSSLSLVAGYKFEDKILYIFDKFSVEMSSLSNEVSSKELKLNIGISF